MALTQATIFRRRPAPTARQAGATKEPINLPDLTQLSNEVLYTTTNVFPFDFFPDRIIVRINHIDFVQGIFFWSGTTERLQIIDVREVTVHYNPFFATLIIHAIGPPSITPTVKYLWRRDALRAKRMILGLLECHQQQVDLSQYSKKDLIAHIEEIGRTKE